MSVTEDSRGWWAISGDALMGMLRRVADGEDPAVVYADEEANCEVEDVYSIDGDVDCLCFCVGGRRVPPSHGPCPQHGDQAPRRNDHDGPGRCDIHDVVLVQRFEIDGAQMRPTGRYRCVKCSEAG